MQKLIMAAIQEWKTLKQPQRNSILAELVKLSKKHSNNTFIKQMIQAGRGIGLTDLQLHAVMTTVSVLNNKSPIFQDPDLRKFVSKGGKTPQNFAVPVHMYEKKKTSAASEPVPLEIYRLFNALKNVGSTVFKRKLTGNHDMTWFGLTLATPPQHVIELGLSFIDLKGMDDPLAVRCALLHIPTKKRVVIYERTFQRFKEYPMAEKLVSNTLKQPQAYWNKIFSERLTKEQTHMASIEQILAEAGFGMVREGKRLVISEKWSGKVKTKFHPPEGLFTKSAEEIANYLWSKGQGKAMNRLNFYINRAGDNLSQSDKQRLEKAKGLISKKIAEK